MAALSDSASPDLGIEIGSVINGINSSDTPFPSLPIINIPFF